MGRKNKFKQEEEKPSSSAPQQQQQPQAGAAGQQAGRQQPSTSSGASGSGGQQGGGGWQKQGGSQQKAQGSQGWGGQQQRPQGQGGQQGQQGGYQQRPQGQQGGPQGQQGGYQQRPQGQQRGPPGQQGGYQQSPQGQQGQGGSQGQQGGYQQRPQGQQGGYQQRQQGQQGGPPGQQGGYQQRPQGQQGGYQQRPQGQQGGYQQRQQGQQGGPPGQQGGYQQRPQGQQGGYQQRPQGQQGGYQQRQQGQQGGPPGQQGGYQQRPQQQTFAPLPAQPAGSIKRGTIGRPGQVAVNYLDIDMSKMRDKAYHYDVKIMPERPKKFYRQAFEQFCANQLGGAVAAYDGRASCYSVDKLPLKTQNSEVTVTDRNGRTLRYTVEIKETADSEIDMKSLTNYMTSRIFDKPMRAIQCMEVVMAAPCHNKAIRSGRSFFKMSEPGQRFDLGDGYEALVGLYQAFMLGDRPFMNVDISHKSFPISMPVMEYLEVYGLRSKINNNTNLDQSRRFIEPFLRGINVVYTPPKSFASAPRVFKVNGLSRNPASTQTFEHEGHSITIENYFKARNYKLQFPNLHCLSVGPPAKDIMVPVELCAIEPGQALNRKDDATQVAAMIKFAATSTNERKRKIMNLLNFFQHNLDPTISRFGIRIAGDFIVVHTRTLNPPQLEYQGKRFSSVRNGSWRMDNLSFLEPKPKAHTWAIVYCEAPQGKMHYNQVSDFERQMFSQSKILNVSLAPKAEIRTFRDEFHLDECFADLKRNQFDLAFVILPKFVNRGSGASYDVVKQKAELQHGILTQCIKQFTVERKLNPQTIGNILLKVNSKLNGINHKLKEDAGLKMIENVMYLGADVTHPSPDQREIPSVVGVAASHDPYGASYNMQYRLQRSALEEIEDMLSITSEHLRVYHQYRKRYPEHILYYRDGVSDGQFPKIKNEELRGINAACAKVGIKPKICCVIVVKRHHTRFFPNGEPSQFNKFNNVDPGTVVDRTIVHPNEMQFFMVSHQSIQGTAKPTRYNVIENTGNLDIDLLQQLTYNLCHMFPRCNRSVSYPAPAYLAHLVAARGRVYLTGSNRFMDLKKEYEKRKIVPEFMKTNPMYFV